MRALLPLLLAAGCLPSSQLLLEVDTDAPVPGLFDRLRIDVLAGDGALADTREISVDDARFRARQVSFGVAPPVGDDSWRVRLRLFRGATRQPPPSSTVDGVLALPAVDRSTLTPLRVRLLTEQVGLPAQPLDPVDAAGDSQVGTWDGAAPRPCAGSPAAGEACVPGGAFFMGDPAIVDIQPQIDTPAERLVVVDAFFIDTHEVTVADFRRQLPRLIPPPPFDPVAAPGPFDPRDLDSWCVWTPAPGANEAVALNCIGRETARRYCRLVGKDLPSEAQHEFIAGGRGDLTYPWGHDAPACSDAVWGLAGAGGVASALIAASYDGSCRPGSAAGGPAPPGYGARDRVVLGDRVVVDLAGNLGEWALDQWSRFTEPFWSGAGVLRNPVAKLVSADAETETVRGGAWYDSPISLRAGFRSPLLTNAYANGVGFRCARPAR